VADKPRQTRGRLFDLLSRNLSLVDPTQRHVVVCPLCLAILPRSDLAGENPRVSLAHIIPASLGGKVATLTCTRCNNHGGSALEAFLVERLTAEDRMAGVGRTSGRLSGKFGNIGVEFEYSPHTQAWAFHVVPSRSNQSDIDQLERRLQEAVQDPASSLHFELTAKFRHRPREVEAAIHQSAYLLLFRYFGYEFVAHPQYAQMREGIRNPAHAVWPDDILVMSEASSDAVLGKHNHAVLFINDPPAIMALMRLRPRGGRPRAFGVVLPGLDSPTVPDVPMTFQFKAIPYCPEALVSIPNYLSMAWQETRVPRPPNTSRGNQQPEGLRS
jgi:hypothetical protein